VPQPLRVAVVRLPRRVQQQRKQVVQINNLFSNKASRFKSARACR
jgi:hypothetical protein